ncbi:MAG: hypothetical protein HYR88_19090 [Verrucomicrobia bacterium]|nr:hypothetical protein [Verrucomicrobiota bacterium]MBI3870368.1 hypothetical protein [Verrucomicrobiota bacterium]
MSETRHSDSFLTLARYASSFSCAIASGFLYSLKRVNPSLQLEIGFGTLLAAILGGVVALFLWKSILEIAGRGEKRLSGAALRGRWIAVLVAAVLLFGSMAGSYWMALKDVRSSTLLEVLQGTGLALLVIAGIGLVMSRLIRLLNRDVPREGSTGEPEDPPSP